MSERRIWAFSVRPASRDGTNADSVAYRCPESPAALEEALAEAYDAGHHDGTEPHDDVCRHNPDPRHRLAV